MVGCLARLRRMRTLIEGHIRLRLEAVYDRFASRDERIERKWSLDELDNAGRNGR